MFNAAYDRNTHWYFNDEMQGVVVAAHRDIKAGEQLLDTYGRKSNYRFFLYYGFIMLDVNGTNPENTYPIWVDLKESDPEYTLKKDIFVDESNVNEQRLFRLVESLQHNDMRDFISWCRFIVFDGDMDVLYEK